MLKSAGRPGGIAVEPQACYDVPQTFLKHVLAPSWWDSLVNVAGAISNNSTPIPPSQQLRGDLEQVLHDSQPMRTLRPGFEVEYFAAWLVHFVYQCGGDHNECMDLLRKGMKMKVERRETAA